MHNLTFAWRAGRSLAVIGIASALAVVAPAGGDCPADFNGDEIVDGGDLGILLGQWNTGSAQTDLNGDGTTDGADLGMLLGSWGPCPPSNREYGRTIPTVGATVQTPAGVRSTFGSMNLRMVMPPPAPGPTPVEIELVSLSLHSVQVFTGHTGGIDLVLPPDQSLSGSIGPSGQLVMPLQFQMHYWAIDQVVPPTPGICTEVDSTEGYTATEFLNGILNAQVTFTAGGLFLEGSFNLTVTSPITGLVTGLTIPVSTAVPLKEYPGLEECAQNYKTNKRTVCIQPVFIGTGAADPAKTGASYPAMKAKADTAWANCCIELEWLAPKYVNKPELKTLKQGAAGSEWDEHLKLLKEEDEKGDNECIEVFFVTHLQDADGKNNDSGDGLTWGSGTKGAKVIIADDATEACDPKSDGVLGHELGHACGNCHHPDGKAVATGTCMEPTGKDPPACPGVNNTKVHLTQCDKMHKGPLVKEKTPKEPCCMTPTVKRS